MHDMQHMHCSFTQRNEAAHLRRHSLPELQALLLPLPEPCIAVFQLLGHGGCGNVRPRSLGRTWRLSVHSRGARLRDSLARVWMGPTVGLRRVERGRFWTLGWVEYRVGLRCSGLGEESAEPVERQLFAGRLLRTCWQGLRGFSRRFAGLLRG